MSKAPKLKEGIDYIYDPQRRLKVDPKELDPRYKETIEQAWHEADMLVLDKFTHDAIVKVQKKILKEKYGIDYKHHYELNPEIISAHYM